MPSKNKQSVLLNLAQNEKKKRELSVLLWFSQETEMYFGIPRMVKNA